MVSLGLRESAVEDEVTGSRQIAEECLNVIIFVSTTNSSLRFCNKLHCTEAC